MSSNLFQPDNAIAAPMSINPNATMSPTEEKPSMDFAPVTPSRYPRPILPLAFAC